MSEIEFTDIPTLVRDIAAAPDQQMRVTLPGNYNTHAATLLAQRITDDKSLPNVHARPANAEMRGGYHERLVPEVVIVTKHD